MICKKCNFQNNKGAQFCGSCGAELIQQQADLPKKKKSSLWILWVILIVAAGVVFFTIDNSNTRITDDIVSSSTTSNNNTRNSHEMVFVQGGTFTMGCTYEQSGDCLDDEEPSHQVTVSDFYIGKYEVTQEQWIEIMSSNPSHFYGDNLPVENVNWTDVQEFISRLNARTGQNYRLPTEAEWEYAARGGNKSNGYKYSGSNMAWEVAWLDENSDSKTHSVGKKQANELGIYDMSGNVWEWCYDWFGHYENYSSYSQRNPVGASSGTRRVFRGGSWNRYAWNVRVSRRNSNTPSYRLNCLGFRLARSSR